MQQKHLVRIGAMGHIGRFASVDNITYPRGARVVCRTARGLEVGEVLTADENGLHHDAEVSADGTLLRGVTVEDDLLLSRLEKNRDKAYQACCDLLKDRGLRVTLMDVEHLFDGRSLVFYFLGEVTPQLENLTQSLADMYETKVQFRKFAEAVTQGCGPDCGTEAAQGGGCGPSGCSSCIVAEACSSRGHQ